MSLLQVYLFTYNCGKQAINSQQFLSGFTEHLPNDVADIYMFGLEEFCSILDGSFYEIANQFVIRYNELFLTGLAEKYGHHDVRFQTIGIHHIGAIALIAITPYPLKFTKLKLAGAGCGYGFSSMKGAVGLRMTCNNFGQTVDLTFVNAHLAANEGELNYVKRNEDLTTIMRSLDFADGYGVLKPNSHTFIMGDLNYRTSNNYSSDSSATKELLKLQDQSLVHTVDIGSLVDKYDELTIGKNRGDIFAGFSEADIDFAPTYKFNINTAIYNGKRSPSWCDRILFQSTYNREETLLKTQLASSKDQTEVSTLPKIHDYNSIASILQSDHIPVYLSMTVPFHAPKPIVSNSGFLQVLPSDNPRHDSGDATAIFDDTITGPTQIYMKPTRYDYVIQNYIRWLSDRTIGYSLFFSTTGKGRLYVLLLILGYWMLHYLMK